jgi:hypothetical protein
MLGQAGNNNDNGEPVVLQGDENNARWARAVLGNDKLHHTIKESKQTLTTEQACGVKDADLARAIKLSKEEEAHRKATLTDSGSLFDEP